MASVAEWPMSKKIRVGRIVSEVGFALNGNRAKFLALLGDPLSFWINFELRDRFGFFAAEYLEAALSAQSRGLAELDPDELDDDLVRDTSRILTSFSAWLYGK